MITTLLEARDIDACCQNVPFAQIAWSRTCPTCFRDSTIEREEVGDVVRGMKLKLCSLIWAEAYLTPRSAPSPLLIDAQLRRRGVDASRGVGGSGRPQGRRREDWPGPTMPFTPRFRHPPRIHAPLRPNPCCEWPPSWLRCRCWLGSRHHWRESAACLLFVRRRSWPPSLLSRRRSATPLLGNVG